MKQCSTPPTLVLHYYCYLFVVVIYKSLVIVYSNCSYFKNSNIDTTIAFTTALG